MSTPNLMRLLPRRITYPLLGVSIGTAAPLAYLLSWHSVTPGGTLALALEELAALSGTWLALTIPGVLLLGGLGWFLGRREDALVAQSTTDSLTGLENLAGHRARLANELARAARAGAPLSLVLVDVDHLKRINDAHGHAAGDVAIQRVAESLRRSCRTTDHAARIGGDEFAILVPGARAQDAVALAERVRRMLATLGAAAPTVSIGVADLELVRARDPAALREAADRALYRAKAEGRDRVVVGGATAAPRELGPLSMMEVVLRA